jgi:hypothetical protein
VIRLVFHKFYELGSARQVLLWMTSQNIHFPYPSDGRTLTSFEWRPIRYRNIIPRHRSAPAAPVGAKNSHYAQTAAYVPLLDALTEALIQASASSQAIIEPSSSAPATSVQLLGSALKQSSTEFELRAELAEGGDNHKDVIKGGAWWRRTQSAKEELEAAALPIELLMFGVFLDHYDREIARQRVGNGDSHFNAPVNCL